MKLTTVLITLLALIFLFNFKQLKRKTESPKTKYVKSTDGVKIGYKVYGNGDIPLIFVHGWCCDKSYWKSQTEHFKKQYEVVLVDLAGHGESELGRHEYTVHNFASDVSAVINKLKLDNCILIGHSLGGYVVLETAKMPWIM